MNHNTTCLDATELKVFSYGLKPLIPNRPAFRLSKTKESPAVEHRRGFNVDEMVGAEDRDGNAARRDGAAPFFPPVEYDDDDIVLIGDIISPVRYMKIYL